MSDPGRSMPRFAWLLGAIGAMAIVGAALQSHQPREPRGAIGLLEELLADGVPHPAGTEAGAAQARRVAAMLQDALSPARVPVQIQEVTVAGPGGAPLPVRNVVARLPGREPAPATLVTAHHDSVAAGPGAGDDGAGVITVLEIARTLARETPNRDVIFLLTDAEELGLFGAIAFCAEHEWFDDIGSVVNLEARGVSGPCAIFEFGHDQAALVQRMRRSVPRPVTSSLADRVYRLMPNSTDFTVYRRVGLPGYNLAFIGGVEHYHQPSDIPANVHPGSLGHMQETALALVRELDRSAPIPSGRSPTLSEWRSRLSIGDPTAMSELRRADLGTLPEPSPQSFHAFLRGPIVSWDLGLSPWLSAAAVLLLLASLTLAWMRGVLPCAAWVGAMGRIVLVALVGGCIMVVTASAAAAYGRNADWGWYRGFGGTLWPTPAWPWLAAIWAAGCGAMSAWWQLVPRRNAWANVAASALLLAAIAAGAAILEPTTAAMLLPIIAVVALAMVLASLLPQGASRYGAAFVGCVQLWTVAFVLAPMEPLVQDALGFGLPVVVIIVPLLVLTAFVALLPGAGDAPSDSRPGESATGAAAHQPAPPAIRPAAWEPDASSAPSPEPAPAAAGHGEGLPDPRWRP